MQALTIRSKDSKYWLEFSGRELPDVPPGHCLVRIKAAALNRRDYWISVGKYPGIRDGVVLGSDGCGEVVSGTQYWIGKTVLLNPNIQWGSDPEVQSSGYTILGTPQDGTFAEYLSIPADRLIEKPSHLDDTEAAAIPLAGLTAYRATFTKAGIRPGDRLLVTGIGGGVSQFVCAFALAAGAEVYVSSSSDAKIGKAIELGAKAGYNYTNPDWVKEAQVDGKFDAVIDSAGGNALNDYLRVVKPGGKIVLYGSTTGKPENIDLFRLFWSQVSIIGSTMGNDQEFAEMVAFVERHQVRPVIDRVYPFTQGIEAVQSMDDSGHFGKVVLRMDT